MNVVNAKNHMIHETFPFALSDFNLMRFALENQNFLF